MGKTSSRKASAPDRTAIVQGPERGRPAEDECPAAVPTRHFCGWGQPLLRSVVEHLTAGWSGGVLDLRGVMIVVPTRQAGRRLREALAVRAAAAEAGVFPPRVVTPEVLVGLVVPAGVRLASDLESLVAWSEVLIEAPTGCWPEVFPIEPSSRSWTWAVAVASTLLEVRSVLAENGLDMAGAAAMTRTTDAPEHERWRQLAEIEQRVRERLRRRGIEEAEAARTAAAHDPVMPAGIVRMVVAGVPDPLPLAVVALGKLAARIPIEVLVHAPTELAATFDNWGRPRAEAWSTRAIDLPEFEKSVRMAADPAAEAAAAAGAVRDGLAAGESTALAVADRDLVPWLRDQVSRATGMNVFDPEGRMAGVQPLAYLLELLEDLLRDRSFASFALLLRQPSVLRALGGSRQWLRRLDEVAGEHLPIEIRDALPFLEDSADRGAPDQPPGKTSRARLVDAAHQVIGLLDAFEREPFAQALASSLTTLYRRRVWSSRDPAAAQWVAMARLTHDRAREIDTALDSEPNGPSVNDRRVSAPDRLALLRHSLERARLDAVRPERAIDVIGWLELPWEDAARVVVAGFNEGRVPDGIREHAFLTDSLRRSFGLRTNETRLARDSFLLASLVGCRRPGAVVLLAGRSGAGNEPLRPSRLLFRCDDDALVQRARHLFGSSSEAPAPVPAWQRAWLYTLRRRPGARSRPIEKLNVTAFRDYLQCPFRFYLRHVLKMEPVDANPLEMDARRFGTFIHRALAELGNDPAMSACDDEKAIGRFLCGRLAAEADRQFGPRRPVPVEAQIEAAMARARAVARVQAKEARDGWRIARTEFSLDESGPWRINGVAIHGRVDRLDRHLDGRIRVLDYKTSNRPECPERTHLAKVTSDADPLPPWRICPDDAAPKMWVDLQLPLYALVLGSALGEPVEAGYFFVPPDAADTKITMLPLDPARLASAAECARGVVEGVVAGCFWPPVPLPDKAFDSFRSLFFGDAEGSVDAASLGVLKAELTAGDSADGDSIQ